MDSIRLELIEKAIRFISGEAEANQVKQNVNSYVQFAGDLLDVDCVFVDIYSEDNLNAVERIACYYQGVFLSNINYNLVKTPDAGLVVNKPDLDSSDIECLFIHDNRLKFLETESYISMPLKRANGDSLGFIGVIYKSPKVDAKTVGLVLQIIATKASQIIEASILEFKLIKRDLEGDEIKRSEERLSFAFEGARDGIWDWNAQTNEVFYSTQWKCMLGYEDNEIGNSYDEWDNRIHPDDKDQVYCDLNALLDKHKTFYRSEHRVLCKDRTYKWILARGKVTSWSKDGKALRVLGTHTDISERKIATIALKEREEALRILADNTFDGMLVNDREGKYLYANCRVVEITGYSIDELRQLNFRELSFYKQYTQQQEICAAKSVHVFETQIQNKEGNDIPIEIIISKIVWMGNQAEIVSIRDISDWKKIESELIESKELFSGLFRNSTMGLYQTTPEGEILLVNPAITKMLGYNSLEELQKRDLSRSSYVHNSKREEFKKLLEEKGEVTGFESAWLTKNGDTIYVNEGARAVKNLEGEIIRYEGAVLDITEKKKVELELIRAKEKAEESDHLKSAFLATMSHELRTPLNAIIGFSDLYKENISVEEMITFAKMINTSGHRLLEMFEDMFSLTLMECGEITIKNECFEIAPFLSDIWDLIKKEQLRFGKQDLNLIFSLHPSVTNLKILTDKNKLKQILIHILKNALRYTNQGHVKFDCFQDIQDGSPILRFEVKDTGIGIKAEDQKVIFDPFRQLNDSYSRKIEGTGIGLSVSQRLSKLLGGAITVDSAINMGSTFSFALPYEDQKSSSRLREPIILDMNWEEKTILIAEDDYSNFDLIQKILRPTSAKLIHAVNGLEAVKLFEIHKDIDLVLMDIRMPVMDGIEAIKAIKLMNPDFPVITLTANTTVEERENALAVGSNGYITKPINVGALYRIINSYLEEKVGV
ncbi:PAS domain S-box protein [Ancylomarina euxinus]|uniref:histidine kinase n=1 Tax=Ancylomarina euxinus TaxID=2283627 RepID=A0A425XWS4_9BACT|nr:PAS domain S-box protein [Ancylomarina euxinus]MCZ4696329.1 PAS domain S-box protein [Ancylomarina euxinus]MUP16706.1 PAS domain S-box protein [Ancylomarina euxinus]RRG19090.1 PAS domain S-box protein [Ancylomarina euxinus]